MKFACSYMISAELIAQLGYGPAEESALRHMDTQAGLIGLVRTNQTVVFKQRDLFMQPEEFSGYEVWTCTAHYVKDLQPALNRLRAITGGKARGPVHKSDLRALLAALDSQTENRTSCSHQVMRVPIKGPPSPGSFYRPSKAQQNGKLGTNAGAFFDAGSTIGVRIPSADSHIGATEEV